MKEYTIPVSWQMISDVKIKSTSLKEAIEKVSQINSPKELPEGNYVNHSFEVQKEFIDEDED